MAPPINTLLQFLIDDEELEELDARRRTQQQRLMYAMQAVRAVLRGTLSEDLFLLRGMLTDDSLPIARGQKAL